MPLACWPMMPRPSAALTRTSLSLSASMPASSSTASPPCFWQIQPRAIAAAARVLVSEVLAASSRPLTAGVPFSFRLPSALAASTSTLGSESLRAATRASSAGRAFSRKPSSRSAASMRFLASGLFNSSTHWLSVLPPDFGSSAEATANARIKTDVWSILLSFFLTGALRREDFRDFVIVQSPCDAPAPQVEERLERIDGLEPIGAHRPFNIEGQRIKADQRVNCIVQYEH